MSNFLNNNHICMACNKDGSEAHVKCMFCHKLFHAIGCNQGADICNKTFLDSFVKFEGKSGSYASRPGVFKFVCDNCITKFEVDQASTTNDKVETLNNKVSNLEKGIAKLTSLFEQNTSLTNNQKSPYDHSNKRWQPAPINCFTPPSAIKVPSEKSLLVIPSKTEKELNCTIEKTLFESSIKINNSFTNKSGDRVLVCNTVNDRDTLKTTLSGKIPDLETKTPNTFRPTIVVVGYSEFFANDIRQNIVHQNPTLDQFFSLNNIDDHFNLMSSSSLKNRPDLHQSIFSVSKQFRLFLENCGDKLMLGFRSCKIYDRFFVRRCFKCQMFGHTSSDCVNNDCCSRCSESHDVKDCKISPNDISKHVCINCKKCNISSDHSTSSFNCPSYLDEKNKVQNKLFNLN